MRMVGGVMEGTCRIWDIFLIQVEIYIVIIDLCEFDMQILPRFITECSSLNLNTDTKLLKLGGVILPLLKEYHYLAQVVQCCVFGRSSFLNV